jgi:diguanylate cyclase (GGDEF)-like protein
MANRLIQGINRRLQSSGNGKTGPAHGQDGSPPRAGSDRQSVQVLAALELAQELLRGVEHFVLSTPDLDTPSFLDHLRRTAAQLTPATQSPELECHRQWAAESLSAFGQLQRRYLSEREDELWRLLTLYQEQLKVEGAANTRFHESLRGVHERIGNVVRLNDLRQVRERLENEIQRATTLIGQKEKGDEERAALLAAQVRHLEAALISARHEAMQDALTGVYHRGAFQEHMDAALQSPASCSLAMIDIDNFKGINDVLGHLVGDEVLRTAVHLLGKIARPGDVIGRFGGDEFCLLAPGTAAERLAERFDSLTTQRTMNFKFEERLCSVRLSFSVGVAGSVAGDTSASLIQRADTTLYEVKRNGKAHTRVAPPPVIQQV